MYSSTKGWYDAPLSPGNINGYILEKSTSDIANGSITAIVAHKLGNEATVTAVPDVGYVLEKWTGANTGTNNPITVTMDTDKTIGASFIKDTNDTDGDGFNNYEELITYSTDPNDDDDFPTRSISTSLFLKEGLLAFTLLKYANDESGNNNNGTVNGASLTSDRFGNVNSAYLFDGDDYIDFGDKLDINNEEFTISAWVKHSVSDKEKVILNAKMLVHHYLPSLDI